MGIIDELKYTYSVLENRVLTILIIHAEYGVFVSYSCLLIIFSKKTKNKKYCFIPKLKQTLTYNSFS